MALIEEEIRPADIFNEFLRLVALDGKRYFPSDSRECILCPACNAQGDFAFEKNGFFYDECDKCNTLYVNPRPSAEAFEKYYTDSASSQYWATTFYRATATARKEKLWKQKAESLLCIMRNYNAENHEVIDIGGGYGIFAETFEELTYKKVTVIEPSGYLADVCKQKGLTVVSKFLEHIEPADLNPSPKVFVSFELFEHLHNPSQFLSCLHALMGSQDLLVFTTLSGAGVDIRTLWNESKAVCPPQHINFFNPYSMQILLERQRFKILDISTPGQLDVNILSNNAENIHDRFWSLFIKHANTLQKEQMQRAIAELKFSSHMLVVCQKIQ